MRIDLHEPLWTQSQVARCIDADDQTLNNYVNHGHASPKLIEGRRRFTALQMIEISFTVQLAEFFKIPPHHGSKISRSLIAHAPAGLLENDAAKIGDKSWVAQASYRGQVTIRKAEDGSYETLARWKPAAEDIVIVFPVQLCARSVLYNASLLVGVMPLRFP
jgi:hypothetical protein